MASTLVSNLLHITFSVKHRQPQISPEHADALYAYIGGICANHNCAVLAAGGVQDHVHLCVSLSKTLALSELMLNLKRDSSKWMKARSSREFAWQDGYFAFSIGVSGLYKLKRYIQTQREHHRVVGFQDEIRALLAKYEIAFDERYIWD